MVIAVVWVVMVVFTTLRESRTNANADAIDIDMSIIVDVQGLVGLDVILATL